VGLDRRGGCVTLRSVDLPKDSPLRELAADAPALVVFLRSFGCTFCREAMADVAAQQSAVRAAGANIAFVHGGTPDEAAPWFARHGLADVARISDPNLDHYRAFGLGRTGPGALVDPHVWTRGAVCALSHGFGAQTMVMMRQLPGVFVVQRDTVFAEYRHRSPSDRPDYAALAREAASADTSLPRRSVARQGGR
jgi:peroxiredoxin